MCLSNLLPLLISKKLFWLKYSMSIGKCPFQNQFQVLIAEKQLSERERLSTREPSVHIKFICSRSYPDLIIHPFPLTMTTIQSNKLNCRHVKPVKLASTYKCTFQVSIMDQQQLIMPTSPSIPSMLLAHDADTQTAIIHMLVSKKMDSLTT